MSTGLHARLVYGAVVSSVKAGTSWFACCMDANFAIVYAARNAQALRGAQVLLARCMVVHLLLLSFRTRASCDCHDL